MDDASRTKLTSGSRIAYAGMGSIAHVGGTAFRVWAPNALGVSVIGSFNEWKPEASCMRHEGGGYWYAEVPGAKVGDEYRFLLQTASGRLNRIDPYAREVTTSVGNAVVHDLNFGGTDCFELAPLNQLVIYEMHIGTFQEGTDAGGKGTFLSATRRLAHLSKLGVNCIEVMPIGEFAGDVSWGYNPSHIFAVESVYGGPPAFKRFIQRCHAAGIGVILDVVYNHLGPSDLDLWAFDGWSENGGGGIYFYNDARSGTPWGNTRPDYGRREVRRYLRDNALMWLEDYRVDGLRYDATTYIRTVDGRAELPDGWGFLQSLNREIRSRLPGKILIAEDEDCESLTRGTENGGTGFHAQWCGSFVRAIRQAVVETDDGRRSMRAVTDAIYQRFNNDAHQRVIYSESHDEVANGKQRLPSAVRAEAPEDWYARKRSCLAAAITLTAPGVPMLFQGQEFLEAGWFQDDIPMDWDHCEEFSSIVKLYRDLIHFRLNRNGNTLGLTGQNVAVYRCDEDKKVLAYHRWHRGGPGDDVVVVANFSQSTYQCFRVGFPAPGPWSVCLNSDWNCYGRDFHTPRGCENVVANALPWDGMRWSAELRLPPYGVLLLSQVAGIDLQVGHLE